MHRHGLFLLLSLLLVISLGAGTMPAGAAEATLPTPVAHWKLDDEGPVAKDAAGSHHGAIHGAVPHAGQIGPGLLFVRSHEDHISIPYAPDLELSTFTVSAWVWLTEPPTFSGILGTRAGGAQLFDVKVNTDKVHGDIGDGKKWIETGVNFYAGDVGSTTQGGDLELKVWYLVTFVIDDARQECRLYLDGDRKKTSPFPGHPKLMEPGRTLQIGSTGAAEFMDGVIDDVRIWKEALTDDQVKELMNP